MNVFGDCDNIRLTTDRGNGYSAQRITVQFYITLLLTLGGIAMSGFDLVMSLFGTMIQIFNERPKKNNRRVVTQEDLTWCTQNHKSYATFIRLKEIYHDSEVVKKMIYKEEQDTYRRAYFSTHGRYPEENPGLYPPGSQEAVDAYMRWEERLEREDPGQSERWNKKLQEDIRRNEERKAAEKRERDRLLVGDIYEWEQNYWNDFIKEMEERGVTKEEEELIETVRKQLKAKCEFMNDD